MAVLVQVTATGRCATVTRVDALTVLSSDAGLSATCSMIY